MKTEGERRLTAMELKMIRLRDRTFENAME